jgi:hypothetical protein
MATFVVIVAHSNLDKYMTSFYGSRDYYIMWTSSALKPKCGIAKTHSHTFYNPQRRYSSYYVVDQYLKPFLENDMPNEGMND